jgi:hypothetical protein
VRVIVIGWPFLVDRLRRLRSCASAKSVARSVRWSRTVHTRRRVAGRGVIQGHRRVRHRHVARAVAHCQSDLIQTIGQGHIVSLKIVGREIKRVPVEMLVHYSSVFVG